MILKLNVSYDSCLYNTDLTILKSETAWLNDRIISFYFEYLSKEVYENFPSLLFIGTEVTQAIKMMQNPEEINAIILDPLEIKNRLFVIFAINDNEVDAVGGSHWSLICYSKPDKSFYHFDSAGNLNYYPCLKFVNIIKACLKLSNDESSIVNVDCLQQNNSYDCGLFTLCHTDLVCKTIVKLKTLKNLNKIGYKSVTVKRCEIIDLIEKLRK